MNGKYVEYRFWWPLERIEGGTKGRSQLPFLLLGGGQSDYVAAREEIRK